MPRSAGSRRDEIDLIAADPWLRELVTVCGGRPPRPERRFGRDLEKLTARARTERAWRARFLEAVALWSRGRRAAALERFGACAELASVAHGDDEGDIRSEFASYVEARFRCTVHDDCIAHEGMGHECWLESPDRAR